MLGITGPGGLNIGSGVLGANLILGIDARMEITAAAAISAGALVRTDGGSLTAATLTCDGTLDHRDGELSVAGQITNNAGGRLFLSGLASPAGPIANAGRITLQSGLGFLGHPTSGCG